MSNCRGQGDDGAGAMAGRGKGVPVRISTDKPFVVYTHCFSHALHLSLMRIIQVRYVKEMFDNCRVLSDYFNDYPKRFELFSSLFDSSGTGETKLINICRTRWVQRSEGIQRFKECYKTTLTALQKIKKNEEFNGNQWNVDNQRTASGLFAYMKKFEFLVTLVICSEIMEYLSALTVCLQGPTLAIVQFKIFILHRLKYTMCVKKTPNNTT